MLYSFRFILIIIGGYTMYELTVLNKFGEISVIKGDDLERLKIIAERMNKNGASVEISQKVVLYRIVQMN